MRIHYTLHALERVHQRRIEKNLVEKCIAEPDKVEEIEGLYRCVKKIDEKVIVVIYRRTNEMVIVITAYISSKVRKYLPC